MVLLFCTPEADYAVSVNICLLPGMSLDSPGQLHMKG